MYRAPETFAGPIEAQGWLANERRLIDLDAWTPPADREAAKVAELAERERAEQAAGLTFEAFAEVWLARRTDPAGTRPLAPLTARDYRTLLDLHLIPAFGTTPVGALADEDVDTWYRRLGTRTPRQRAKAYALLSTIMGAAVKDRTLPAVTANPCRVEGAMKRKRRTAGQEVDPATLEELATIRAAVEPARYAPMVDLAAWCALRFGELAELRRKDVRLTVDAEGQPVAGVLRIRRGVTFTRGQVHNERTKSEAGHRDVTIPPHLLPTIAAHLVDKSPESGAPIVGHEPAALLFPAPRGGYLRQGTFVRWWVKARAAAGRQDLRFHDLRHTGLTYAAQVGATTRELMDRAGHTTPAMAMHYQHTARGRDAEIAAALSRLASPAPAAAPVRAAAVTELAELVAQQAAELATARARLRELAAELLARDPGRAEDLADLLA